MKKFIHSLLFLLFSATLFGQGYTILLEQSQKQNLKIRLEGFYGNESFSIDSFKTDQQLLKINFPIQSYYEGFYRLVLNDSLHIDFIGAEGDSLAVKFNPDNFYNSIEVRGSSDNTLLLKLIRELSEMNREIAYLSNLNVYDSLSFYAVRSGVLQLKERKNKRIDFYRSQFKHSAFSVLALMNKEVLSGKEESAKSEYLSTIDFTNSSVIHTNYFPAKILDYFGIYHSPEESSFKSACDSLLKRARANDAVYNYTLYFLMRLFSEMGPEIIFQHLITNYYLADNCGEVKTDQSTRDKINNFVRLMPGNTIPEYVFSTSTRRKLKLSSVYPKNKFTILFFWNPDCFHCGEILPKLVKVYPEMKKNGIDVISFSITDDKLLWNQKSKEFRIPWLDHSDLMGWKSPCNDLFSISKTPFFIVINQKGIIQKFDANEDYIFRFLNWH